LSLGTNFVSCTERRAARARGTDGGGEGGADACGRVTESRVGGATNRVADYFALHYFAHQQGPALFCSISKYIFLH